MLLRVAVALALLGLAAAAAAAGGGCSRETAAPATSGPNGAESLPRQKTPEEAWHDFRHAVEREDHEGIWNTLSAASKDWIITGEPAARVESIRRQPPDRLADLARQSGVPATQLKQMTVPDLARLIAVNEVRQQRANIVGAAWQGAEVVGSVAVARTARPDGAVERLVLVREDGTWKLDSETTWRLRNGKL